MKWLHKEVATPDHQNVMWVAYYFLSFLRYYNGIIKIDGAKVRKYRQKKSSYWLYAPNQKVSIEDYEEETQL